MQTRILVNQKIQKNSTESNLSAESADGICAEKIERELSPRFHN